MRPLAPMPVHDDRSCGSCRHFIIAKTHPLNRVQDSLCKHPRTLGAATVGRALSVCRERGSMCGPRGALWEQATGRIAA